MRIETSKVFYLTKHMRAIRLAVTVTITLLSLAFFIASYSLKIRPNCCAAQLGASCTSCGITRSVAALLRGKLQSSLEFHNAGIWLVSLLAISLAFRPIPYIFQTSKVILLDLIVFCIMWIIISCAFFGLPGSGYIMHFKAIVIQNILYFLSLTWC